MWKVEEVNSAQLVDLLPDTEGVVWLISFTRKVKNLCILISLWIKLRMTQKVFEVKLTNGWTKSMSTVNTKTKSMKIHLMDFQIIPINRKMEIILTFLIKHKMDLTLRAAGITIFKSYNIKKWIVLLANNLFKHNPKPNRNWNKLKKYINIIWAHLKKASNKMDHKLTTVAEFKLFQISIVKVLNLKALLISLKWIK